MTLRERFDAWVQGMVNKAVKRHIPDPQSLVNAVVTVLDYPQLIARLADSDELCEAAAQKASERVEDDIDTDEIARKVAETVDASDVASHIDMDDVCNNLDVSNYLDEIAEKLGEEIDVSSCIDYDQLAEKLVEKLKEAWA
jgi:hypothetical protein